MSRPLDIGMRRKPLRRLVVVGGGRDQRDESDDHGGSDVLLLHPRTQLGNLLAELLAAAELLSCSRDLDHLGQGDRLRLEYLHCSILQGQSARCGSARLVLCKPRSRWIGKLPMGKT
ncbi:MAG TPA: hypothetical protein DFR83_02190 [Deltaproteobacteria bacterium]|nr:hypothetical protein [Deltaproteobacteria bacterium]